MRLLELLEAIDHRAIGYGGLVTEDAISEGVVMHHALYTLGLLTNEDKLSAEGRDVLEALRAAEEATK